MKIKFTTVLKGNKRINNTTINQISEKLSEILESRFNASLPIKKLAGTFYAYLIVNPELNTFNAALLKERMYTENNENIDDDFEISTFLISLKAAIKNNISIPEGIDNIIVYFSLSSMDFTNSTSNESSSNVTFQAIDPLYKLDDVIMNDNERTAVMRAIILVKEKELIYNKWGFSSVDHTTKSVLCFHGVPGTGKTMCAHAVAHFLGKKLIIGSYSSIESEFVGVGCKNLRAIFKAAEEQDAVLFIDEADTFLSKRLPSSNDSSKHYNSMSNELFQMLEEYNGCVIFASNHITDFDPAVISRIIEPIEFVLPDKKNRSHILRKMIPSQMPLELFGDNVIDRLVEITEGFSGRDMRKSVLVSCANAVLKYKIEQKLEDDAIVLNCDDLYLGFLSVKDSFGKLKSSIKGEVPVDPKILQKILNKKRFQEAIIQIAQKVLYVDGTVDDKEAALLVELSQMFGMTAPNWEEIKEIPLAKICELATHKEQKDQLLEVACRMAAIDNQIPDSEIALIKEIYTILGYDLDQFENITSYLENLLACNSKWNSIVNN